MLHGRVFRDPGCCIHSAWAAFKGQPLVGFLGIPFNQHALHRRAGHCTGKDFLKVYRTSRKPVLSQGQGGTFTLFHEPNHATVGYWAS